MFKPLLASALCALSLSAIPAHAVNQAQFQPAMSTFLLAVDGDPAAIEPAAQAFADLSQAEPGNAVLLAYRGAATAMQANTVWAPWKKMRHAEDGLALLDKALAMQAAGQPGVSPNGAPPALEIQFTAARTFLAVPAFFHRHERGMQLLNQVLASPLLGGAPGAFRQRVEQTARQFGVRP